jgi:ABC-type cobalamin/Fe3+-siderophores transport system ATPase subunit
MATYNDFSKGSEWRKWDLHIHTPNSIVQNYDGDAQWEKFIEALERLPQEVKVLGINDYYFIDGYEKVMQYKKQGRLSNIEKILSVLEFRIDTFGSGNENNLQKINLHIIFNIDENNLEKEIRRIKKEFIELIPITKLEKHQTKILSHENLTQEGDNDLQKGFSSLIPSTEKVFELLNSPTWKDKCFLLLGYKEWSNLEKNNQLKPLKENLYNKVNAFFTSNYNTFEKSKGWLDEFGNKPLLHSCDVHGFDILDTANKGPSGVYIRPTKYHCNTWIKADPTFEGLKQIIYEPANRVFVGKDNPDLHRENCINSIVVDKDWFPDRSLPLNKGLISIIGARGSGKTALLDLVSLGTNAYSAFNASFLKKAEKEVQPLNVRIDLDGQEFLQNFTPGYEYENPSAKYLSQQFVESLCSEDGSTERLQSEIERFIFESIDGVERMGTSKFSELRDLLCELPENTIKNIKGKISELNGNIAKTYQLQNVDLPTQKKDKENLEVELGKLNAKIPQLDTQVQNQQLQEYEDVNNKKITLENELKNEQYQYKDLERIYNELIEFNQSIGERNKYFKQELKKYDIDKIEWAKINIGYPDTLLKCIENMIEMRKNAFMERYGSKENPSNGTYSYLKQKLDDIKLKVNTYTAQEKYYLEISQRIKETTVLISEKDKTIKKIEGLSIEVLQKERGTLYANIFKEIKKVKDILEKLYKPLIVQLQKNEQEQKLGFFVKVVPNTLKWAKQGENLIDLRKAKEFSDHKALYIKARDKLENYWISCDSDNIGNAINDFLLTEGRLMSKNLLDSTTSVDLANWLFSVDHIKISYEVTFDNIPLKQLSPGTKGVLLMLLYLGVDKNDTRPLLIDQPEDNLDPESVYGILVPYFLEAKRRRQIIMITHNPNLVVGTDSDQVIVASIKEKMVNQLPKFNYIAGGLENPEIVKKVCSILEGGKMAFLKREHRYFNKQSEKDEIQ